MTVNFKTGVKEVEVEGETKYVPYYVLGKEELLITHQDVLVYFNTKEQAEEYIED
jgi:hypothetical protein